ncbi:hypothetical protein CHL76_02410 [Marinococcus halophilus]|uniref:Uncharacterized protein n=1 Tax=Marinococcus halophilus TaxID=1371 RepID=A0A510Y3K9_MARHA|nr:hypothetical protein [Marinococcus halophilus]OZT81228.1 hypothetical protein CHL76_02410 [Marinococcus halophilus]GEK57167.1 hypothetical protein MHA01_00720 [Marinococcus halophilus]
MKFSEMNKAQLREARNELTQELKTKTVLRPTKVMNLTDNGVQIEGGKVPANFERDGVGGDLYIRSKCSRHSGSQISVIELLEVENVINDFYDAYINDQE